MMTERSQLLKKAIGETKLDSEAYLIYFEDRDLEVFGAEQVTTIVSIFDSHVNDGGSNLIRWNKLEWTLQNEASGLIYVYVRSGSNKENTEASRWQGPYFETTIDLSDITNRYVQFRIVFEMEIKEFMDNPPFVEQATVSNYNSESASVFYLNTTELGFNPQRIVLTHNAITNNDSIIQFAVTGEDTLDSSKYQTLTSHTINELDDIPELTKKIKFMMKASGRADESFSVDEFSILIAGTGKTRLN